MTLIGALVVFTNVSFGSPDPLAAALLIPATSDLLQMNCVPAEALVGKYENTVLLQTAGGVRELVSTGLGLTDTTTSYEVVLTQPLADKVYL